MKLLKPALIAIFTTFLVGTIILLGTYFYIKADLPSVDVLKDVRLQTPMRIYTQDGKLISQYGVKRRIPLTLEQIPLQLQQAVIATEDSRFYEHPGIDPIGMMRALINLVVTGEKGQGGSTLTMQMARDFFLTREKKYIRKIREIILAWHMEQLLSKQEILELYLNKVELGHRAFGFGAAAQVYYGKPLSELSLAQFATIAGLPQAPSTLNPISRPERSLARRRIVLLRMLDEEYISRAQFEKALSEPVTAKKYGAEIDLDAPYLADIIYNEMIDLYGKNEAETGGYQVYATASSTLQAAAQRAVRRNLHDYDERHGYRGPEKQLWSSAVNELLTAQEAHHATDSKPWQEDQMLSYLQEVKTFEPLLPAIVVKVNETDIIIYNKQGKYSIIDWDGLDWARPFINDSKQGPAPQKASDILQEGALILIRQREHDLHWQLAQYPQASSAFVALDPKNGAAQAVIGGYSFYQSQFNRATQAERQVGSNIKPFIYSAALENGYTLASVINDAPITQWQAGSGNAWRPENSPPEYDGPIRMRVALSKSKNVVSVRLLRAVGLENIAEYLTRFGFDKDDIPLDETLSLGSGSHTPLEVATAMAVIANGGFLIHPHFIQRIENEMGEVLWKANPVNACSPCEVAEQLTTEQPADTEDIEALLAAEFGVAPKIEEPVKSLLSAPRVISAENAFLVAEMMRSAVQINGSWDNRGTGWRAALLMKRSDLAGKTGTTNDVRDTWFSGFTPDLVATTWVGFDDNNRRLGRTTRNQNLVNKNPQKFNYIGNALIGSESGGHAAQPAWIRFMQYALADKPEHLMPMPTDLLTVRIDKGTGKLTTRTDKTSMFEYFAQGTQPQTFVADAQIVEPAEQGEQSKKQIEDIF
ncbi:penicillin-binding protein 1A [uncultured Paraglaciecola sp.]|uniref:penicillin-binding protein 1A n=1 Tax=uncultured Paraglaciecola sp. TaxID=1765024 RepID=UPI00260486CF|nr:penicillin-binding protein 1A [uncultured Paraglaciecola sp.]